MIRRPPVSTRSDTLLPDPALFRSKGKPTPITEGEASRIIKQVSEGVDRPKPSITFEIGEQVRVADGPFATFNGYVEDVAEEKRSEEHTSELQSLMRISYAVFRLKKNINA